MARSRAHHRPFSVPQTPMPLPVADTTPVAGEQDSEEEREVNLRTMAEMNEDSPYNGYWDM